MNRIKQLRKENNLTQMELAKRLNMSDAIITMYENGKRTPSIEALVKLSQIFNCSVDYLLGIDDEEKDMPRKTEFKKSLGRRLRNLREQNDMTQDELGEKLNLSSKTISSFETGYNEPDGETLVMLANMYNVSTDYLLGNTINKNPVQQLNSKLSKLNLNREEFNNSCKAIKEYYSGDNGIIKPIDLQNMNDKEKMAFMEFQTVMSDYFNRKLGEELGDDFELFPLHNPNEKEKTKLKITQIYIQDKIDDIISQLDKERIINGNS